LDLNSTPTVPSLISRNKSIATSIQKLPVLQSSQSAHLAMDMSRCVWRSDQLLDQAVDCLRVMYTIDKQMLVFNFIFDLLWTDTGSLSSSVAILWFCELKWIEKHVAKLLCGFSQ